MPWLKKQDVPQWLFNTNTLSIRMERGEARYFVSDIHLERDIKNHHNPAHAPDLVISASQPSMLINKKGRNTMSKFKINDRVRLNGLLNTHLTQFDHIGTITSISLSGYVVELNGVTYHAMKDSDLKLADQSEGRT